MTDTEYRRVDAIARATIIGRPITIWEGSDTVQWPFVAVPIPALYERDRARAVALAQQTKLESYLPVSERFKLWLKSIPARIRGSLCWWWSL